MKWRDNYCMAFNFTSVLPFYTDMQVKPILISHYYNFCLSFSPCQFNSDTNLYLCIFILATVFQQLWNLFTFGNSVIASAFILNATIIFPFASITLMLNLREIFPFSSPIVRKSWGFAAAQPILYSRLKKTLQNGQWSIKFKNSVI